MNAATVSPAPTGADDAMPITIAELDDFAHVQETHLTTWEEFGEALLDPDALTHKEQTKFVVGARFDESNWRAREHLIDRNVVSLDFDCVKDITAFVDSWNKLGHSAYIHTTFSHPNADGTARLRVFILLSRPVSDVEWYQRIRPWVDTFSEKGATVDDRARDSVRISYGPSGGPNYHLWPVKGSPLDVDSLPATGDVPPAGDCVPEGWLPPDSSTWEAPNAEGRAQAIELLGAAWPDRGRHTAQLALAGGLRRDGWPKDEAETFLRAVCRRMGDEDPAKRAQTIEDTYSAGVNIIGWNTLASSVGWDVVSAAREALIPPRQKAVQTWWQGVLRTSVPLKELFRICREGPPAMPPAANDTALAEAAGAEDALIIPEDVADTGIAKEVRAHYRREGRKLWRRGAELFVDVEPGEDAIWELLLTKAKRQSGKEITTYEIERAIRALQHTAERKELQGPRSAADMPDTYEKPECIVEDFVQRGANTTIAGAPDHGKSTWVLAMAVAVATGAPFLGRKTVQGRVCICSFEWTEAEVRKRLEELGVPRGRHSNVDVWALPEILSTTGDDPNFWKMIKASGAKHGQYSLIVVDTLPASMGMTDVDQNTDPKMARPLYLGRALAAEIGAGVVYIMHTNKNAKADKLESFRGSPAIAGHTDTAIGIEKIDTPAGSGIARAKVICIRQKSGERFRTFSCEMNYRTRTMTVMTKDQEADAEVAQAGGPKLSLESILLARIDDIRHAGKKLPTLTDLEGDSQVQRALQKEPRKSLPTELGKLVKAGELRTTNTRQGPAYERDNRVLRFWHAVGVIEKEGPLQGKGGGVPGGMITENSRRMKATQLQELVDVGWLVEVSDVDGKTYQVGRGTEEDPNVFCLPLDRSPWKKLEIQYGWTIKKAA